MPNCQRARSSASTRASPELLLPVVVLPHVEDRGWEACCGSRSGPGGGELPPGFVLDDHLGDLVEGHESGAVEGDALAPPARRDEPAPRDLTGAVAGHH